MKFLIRILVAWLLICGSGAALALDVKPYTADAFAKAQRANQPVALLFHADWCPTCRLQQKTIAMLQEEPGLDGLTILKVDYDRDQELRRRMKVRAQSTLIVYKGKVEKGRSAGITEIDALRAALQAAL